MCKCYCVFICIFLCFHEQMLLFSCVKCNCFQTHLNVRLTILAAPYPATIFVMKMSSAFNVCCIYSCALKHST